MPTKLIARVTSDAYRRRYRIRRVGEKYRTAEVTIPKEVIQREADNVDLTPDEFLRAYRAEWLYDDFGGAFLRFVPEEDD